MKFGDALRTLKAFFVFNKEIKEEKQNPDSLFNKYQLSQNGFGDVIYKQYDFDDSDFMSADYSSEKMVMTRVNKEILEYIGGELQWGDNMVLRVQQFVGEDDMPTHSYAVTYMFDGANDAANTMFKFGLWFVGAITFIGVLMAIILL